MALTESDLLRIKEKVEVLNGDRRAALDKRAFRYGEIRDLEEFIAKLRGGAAELGGKVESIGIDAQEIRATLERAVNDIGALQGDVGELRASINAASQEIQLLQNRISAARMDIDAVVGNTSTVQQDLETIRKDMTRLNVPGQTSINVAATPTAEQFNKAVADIGALVIAVRNIKGIIDL